MYANQGKEIMVPTSDCTDAECIQNFELNIKKELCTLELAPLTTKLP
jgi:hypothetical protein